MRTDATTRRYVRVRCPACGRPSIAVQMCGTYIDHYRRGEPCPNSGRLAFLGSSARPR